MKPSTRKLLSFLFIFATLAVVLYIGVSGQELDEALVALKSISPMWIALCALCFIGYVFFDSLAVWYFLKRQGYAITMRYSLFVAIAGLYYSYVTPGATGGQPMQIYYMKRKNVPVGIGTSAITVKFFCFQFMLAVLSTVLWIAYHDFIHEQVGANRWILILGYTYNCVCVSAVVLVAVSKRIIRAIAKPIISIGKKLHLIKSRHSAFAKLEDTLGTFHSSIMMLKDHPVDFLIQLLIGTLQLLMNSMVIVFLYYAFNLKGVSNVQLVALAIMQYISAAYTPLPGASGAQEGIFALYFSQVFPDGIRLMVLLIWRFFTYYLALILGAVVVVGRSLLPKKWFKRKTEEQKQS